jgi:hypothetical protein
MLHRIMVTFGHPEPVASLRASGSGRTGEERIVDGLHQRLLALAAEAEGSAGSAATAGRPDKPVGRIRQ